MFETSLCHVGEKQVVKAIRELNRVVKTGVVFGSVTSDMAPAVIDRYDLLRGVKKLGTWWEWSELFFGNGFDLAMHRNDCTDAVWAATLAADKGPGHWYADSDSLRYSFFDKVDADELSRDCGATSDMRRACNIADQLLRRSVLDHSRVAPGHGRRVCGHAGRAASVLTWRPRYPNHPSRIGQTRRLSRPIRPRRRLTKRSRFASAEPARQHQARWHKTAIAGKPSGDDDDDDDDDDEARARRR